MPTTQPPRFGRLSRFADPASAHSPATHGQARRAPGGCPSDGPIARRERRLPVRMASLLVAVAVAWGGTPVLAAGLSDAGSQLFFETGANPIHPPAAGDELGYAVAVGDFDGDGTDDVAIGLRNDDNPLAGLSDVGQVQIRFGAPGVGLQGGVNVKYLWQGGLAQVDEPEPGDHFGQALAVGDFDDDGFDDLVVGVPGEDVGTISNAGAVEVRYGAANRSVALDARRFLLHENVAGIPDNAGVDDEFGHALATGDFDGDTFEDLAVGVPLESVNGESDAGRVFVLYGTPLGLSVTGAQTLDGDTSGVGAAFTGHRFGFAIAAADFDNDSYCDLAVGVPGAASGAGWGHVLPGTPSGLTGAGSPFFGQAPWGLISTAESDDRFGYAMATGDFDGDPFPDLVVSAPGEDFPSGDLQIADAGAVHVLFGSAIGVATAGSQFWDAGRPGVPGEIEVGDQFGYSLAAGDFDGDGYDELAIGVPFEQNFRGPGEGDVIVLPGTPSGPTGTGSLAWNLEVGTILGDMNPGDHLGWCLAVGDFDHTTAQDLVIGIPNDGNIGAALALYGTLPPFGGFADGFEGGSLAMWTSHTP